MASHRTARVAEAIREVVASSILIDLHDPRVRNVTVLRVEVTGDLRHAKVFLSVMGSPAEQRSCLRALQHAAGFLQGKVAKRLQTRYTPILEFELDEMVKKQIAMSKLIDEAIASDRKPGETDPDDEDEPFDDEDLDEDEDVDDEDETPPNDDPGATRAEDGGNELGKA